jgi:hypothetical protein
MFYEIKVDDDGDIFVTKLPKKPSCSPNLVKDSLAAIRAELEDYGARRIEEDIAEIEAAGLHEEVRCY